MIVSGVILAALNLAFFILMIAAEIWVVAALNLAALILLSFTTLMQIHGGLCR